MKAFVLGGSSSIGQAVVRAMLAEGHEVAATYNASRPAGLDGASWTRADVRSPEDVDALAGPASGAEVAVLLPGLSLGQRLGEYTDAQIEDVVAVNFTGQFRVVQRIAPSLAEGSHVIVLGSMAAQRGSADPLYGATKGAMHALAKSLAKSLAPRTRVNVVAPGMVSGTAMADGNPREVLDAHLAATPTRRFIHVDELAQVVLDVTRPHWAQLNGACIDLNGGQYVR